MPPDIAALEAFAAQMQAGLDRASPADRHRIFKLLRLRGTVRPDPEHGVQLKRHRFAIDWTALLELRHDPGSP